VRPVFAVFAGYMLLIGAGILVYTIVGATHS
jgi:hypothetical protein